MKIDKAKLQLRDSLKKYVEECSEFICEVPKVRALQILDLSKCAKLAPFRTVYTRKCEKRKLKTYVEDIHVTLNEYERLLDDAYNLQRKCASEIFEFILCDTDREYNKDFPANNPVAYAMKGNSINMNTAGLMIKEV